MTCSIFWLVYFTIHLSKATDDELRTTIAVKYRWDRYTDAIASSPSSFKDLLIRSNMIVDKSLFIREILYTKSKLNLLTCPRKWGKSVNLDMLRTFLQPEMDDEGFEITPQTETRNYRLFKDGDIVIDDDTTLRLRHPLLISNHDQLFQRYQGQQPVVYVNFTNFQATDYPQFVAEIMTRIRDAYEEHQYVRPILRRNITLSLQNTTELEINLKKFEAILREELIGIRLDETLRFLTEMIQLSTGRRSYVLVDDYEAPLMSVLLNEHFDGKPNASELYQRLMAFTFELNYHLQKAVLTGTLHVANAIDGLLRFSGQNFYQSDIYEFFGFTEMEVILLCERLSIPEKIVPKLARWYNGYRAGKNAQLKLYNPFSVVNFLLKRKIKVYWTETQIGNKFFDKLLQMEPIKDLLKILTDERDCSYDFVNLYIEQKDFDDIKSAFDNETFRIDDELVLKYLYSVGYLTLNLDDPPEENQSYEYSYFKLPNKEICQTIMKKLGL